VKPHRIKFELSSHVQQVIARETDRMERLHQRLEVPKPAKDLLAAATKAVESKDWSFFRGRRGTRLFAHVVVEETDLLLDNDVMTAFSKQIQSYPSKSTHSTLLQLLMGLWGSEEAELVRELVAGMEAPARPHPLTEYLMDEDGDSELAWVMPDSLIDAPSWFAEMKLALVEDARPFIQGMWGAKAEEIVEGTLHESELGRTLAWLKWMSDFVVDPVRLLTFSRAILRVEEYGWETGALRTMSMECVGGVDEVIWKSIGFLDQSDQNIVQEAHGILEGWVNELFLERFWHVVQDPRRREFWRKHVKEMRNVRLILESFLYNGVKSVLGDPAYARRISHGSSGGVLVFHFRGKVYVEFGGLAGGALQVIPLDHHRLRGVESELDRHRADRGGFDYNRRGMTLDTLKVYGKDQLIYLGGSVISEFGKFNHQGDWESSLRKWMARYARR